MEGENNSECVNLTETIVTNDNMQIGGSTKPKGISKYIFLFI